MNALSRVSERQRSKSRGWSGDGLGTDWGRTPSHSRLVFARLRVDADLVALVHERRHLDHEAGLERRRFHLRARRRALDAGHGLLDDEIHGWRELDADRLDIVELHPDR